ncbi:MAG: peptidoglycan DD-metalloendopeptidase family protein [Bacteroidales bacterium]|nr:peptidoglycan DD-metalloendopeptidase family protein [Bacteroidales bacterium]
MNCKNPINPFILRLAATAVALLCVSPMWAQSPASEKGNKSVVKVNKLDIIYEEEEYKGVVIEQKESDFDDQNYIYQAPFVVSDPVEEEDDEETLRAYNSIDDEAAESEDEILMAGLDSTTIHVPKADVAHMQPLTLDLGRFVYPTPYSSRPTSHFGPRRRRFHYGLDLAQPTGEPIYAAFDGVVRISLFNHSYGNLVILRHANGLETYYAHMSKRKVSAGDHVTAGQVIGLTGNTGRSYGSHLHFEVRYEGNAINPEHVVSTSTHDLVNKQITLTPSSFRKTSGSSQGSGVTTGANGAKYYRVRSGDTLSRIAKRNGTTVKRLCQLNGIKETTILQIGRNLRIR